MKFIKNSFHLNKGFTFIELLVSISIVLLLSSVAVVSFQSSNRRARDNKRKADLEQVRSALEMIRSDMGCYPGGTGDCSACTVTWGSALTCGVNPVITYMNRLPQDPKNGQGYSYYYDSTDGSSYDLCSYLEVGGAVETCGGSTLNCGNDGGTPDPVYYDCKYKLVSP